MYSFFFLAAIHSFAHSSVGAGIHIGEGVAMSGIGDRLEQAQLEATLAATKGTVSTIGTSGSASDSANASAQDKIMSRPCKHGKDF